MGRRRKIRFPCKKCGGQGVLHGSGYDDHVLLEPLFYVACEKCGEYTTEQCEINRAIEVWNKYNDPKNK